MGRYTGFAGRETRGVGMGWLYPLGFGKSRQLLASQDLISVGLTAVIEWRVDRGWGSAVDVGGKKEGEDG